MIPIYKNVNERLDAFYNSNKIPHIIFHGPSGSGKRTIVHEFIQKIYNNNKEKIKSNVMYVNCAHGKGIKFIREDLKFFAKTNIQFNNGVIFKTIVLLNADNLTIDAQSALRRCIELFSYNTRFFIIVENKHKLLNPILSRFCEIYIPEHNDEHGKIINLHQYNISKKFDFSEIKKDKKEKINYLISQFLEKSENFHLNATILSNDMYESGFSCLDLMDWIETTSIISDIDKSNIFMCFHKIKLDFRCEKILIFYMLDYIFFRSNKDLKNVSFM